jgi:hypothetical protein
MSDPVPPQPVEGKNTSAGRPRPWYRLALLLAVVLFIPSVRKHLPGWTQNKKFDQEVARAIDQALREELGNKPLPVLKREAAEILPTGLDTGQLRETWHRTPEGSDVFPVALLQALKDPSSGRPLIEIMERYGFVASPVDDTGLPVGFTRLLSKNGDFVMTGINCAACHSSRITHKGRSLYVDGAPNFVDIEAFFRGVIAATEGLLKPDLGSDQVEFLLRFAYFNSLELDRLRKSGNGDTGYGGPAAAPSVLLSHEKAEQSLEFLLQQLRSAVRIMESFEKQTPAGPGRADSFGIIRNILMTPELVGGTGNFRPMTAPVSIPHLFGFASFTNLHWDGNTTTGTDRNYAQAIALGAKLDPKTLASSTRPYGLYQMEMAAWKLTPPRWPEAIFGAVDPARVARGRKLFQSQSCVDCHTGETWTRLEVIGTDPNRLLNYNEPIDKGWSRTESYATNLHRFAVAVKQKAYADNNVSAADQKRMDTWHDGVPAMWIETKEKGYFTRPLRGLWATAPFLHNGSVPTLWDLLQPAAKRPARFPVGHREFDPKKVGYVDAPAKVVWEFDTSVSGNRNTGHEYGTGLTDEQKWDLVEYLKTL